MIEIPVKFLGGMREEMGTSLVTLLLPQGATVDDLKTRLKALGVPLHSEDTIVMLNDLGIDQWDSGRVLVQGDVVVVFPNIAGG